MKKNTNLDKINYRCKTTETDFDRTIDFLHLTPDNINSIIKNHKGRFKDSNKHSYLNTDENSKTTLHINNVIDSAKNRLGQHVELHQRKSKDYYPFMVVLYDVTKEGKIEATYRIFSNFGSMKFSLPRMMKTNQENYFFTIIRVVHTKPISNKVNEIIEDYEYKTGILCTLDKTSLYEKFNPQIETIYDNGITQFAVDEEVDNVINGYRKDKAFYFKYCVCLYISDNNYQSLSHIVRNLNIDDIIEIYEVFNLCFGPKNKIEIMLYGINIYFDDLKGLKKLKLYNDILPNYEFSKLCLTLRGL